MSYADGLAAWNLEMPSRIPHTEFDAQTHWRLVQAVTGLPVTSQSDAETRQAASCAFVRAWNYDTQLSACIHSPELESFRTYMGHSIYADGGVDWDARVTVAVRTPEEALALDPWALYGPRDRDTLIRRFNEHYRGVCALYPDLVNMSGIYITLLTGLTYMLGWDMLLLAAGTDPAAFGALANRYTSWIYQYYEALAASEVPIIYSHDDIVWTAGAFLRPAWYREYIFPNLNKLYAPLRDSGKKILWVCDGNYTEFIEDIVALGVHGFFYEPLTDLRALVQRCGQTHVLIGGADTRVLLSGTREQIRAEVKRCLDLGRACPGYFMGVSNMIPANTPVQNALYYYEAYQELSKR